MAAPKFGGAKWLIRVSPRAGYGSSACGGAGCVYDEGAWSFRRALGATSTASIAVPKASGCCDCVPRKWRDELSFWRRDDSGKTGAKPDWIGPVVDVQDNGAEDTLVVFARDRSAWFAEENPIPDAISTPQTAADRFRLIVALTDAIDPSGISLVRYGSGVGALVESDVAQWASTQSELNNLSNFGVTWTMVGDELRYGDLSALCEPVPLDPAVAWSENGAIVTDKGSASITALVVKAKDGRVLVWPSPPMRDACVGSHIRVIEPQFSLPGGQLERFARAQFDAWSQIGVSIETSTESSLSEDWPTCLPDMTPGMRYKVDATGDEFCIAAKSQAILSDVTVQGLGCDETAVKVTLAAADTVISTPGV